MTEMRVGVRTTGVAARTQRIRELADTRLGEPDRIASQLTRSKTDMLTCVAAWWLKERIWQGRGDVERLTRDVGCVPGCREIMQLTGLGLMISLAQATRLERRGLVDDMGVSR